MKQTILITTRPALLAALFLVAPAAAATESTQCSSQSCFKRAFRQCQPVTMMTQAGVGAQAKYAIEGKAADGCRLSLTFVENPNPAWVDKPMTFVLDPAGSLDEQIEAAVPACLAGSGGEFHCNGPLAGITGGVVAISESADTTSAGTPCGQAVTVSGEPLYPLPRDGKWGYANRAGDWVIEPQWRQVTPFSEGRAVVDAGTARRSLWGVIDRQGNYVLEPSLRAQSLMSIGNVHFDVSPVKPFSEGCAAVVGATASDAPYFITRNGDFWLRDGLPTALADLDVREFGSFSEGKVWFRVMPNNTDDPVRYGWINSSGAVVIEPKFTGAGNFAGGLAPAAVNEDNWGYIDSSGTLVFPRKWRLRSANAFSDGMALADIGDRELAFTDGETWAITKIHFTPPRTVGAGKKQRSFETAPLDDAGAFSDGLAPVRALPWPHRAVFYINTDGDIVLEPGKHFTLCKSWGYRYGVPSSRTGAPVFRNGLAQLLVANDGKDCGKLGTSGNYAVRNKAHYIYIDTQGQVALEEPYRSGDSDAHPQQDT